MSTKRMRAVLLSLGLFFIVPIIAILLMVVSLGTLPLIDIVPWGLWVAAFVLTVPLGAVALITACISAEEEL